MIANNKTERRSLTNKINTKPATIITNECHQIIKTFFFLNLVYNNKK